MEAKHVDESLRLRPRVEPRGFDETFQLALKQVLLDRNAQVFKGMTAEPIENGRHYTLRSKENHFVFECPAHVNLKQLLSAMHTMPTHVLIGDREEWIKDEEIVNRRHTKYKEKGDKVGIEDLSHAKFLRRTVLGIHSEETNSK